METKVLFDAVEISAGGSEISEVIDLEAYVEYGYFSLQLIVTGDGTLKAEYMISNDKQHFVTKTAAADQIVIGFTKTGGPGTDGIDVISFEPEPCPQMRIKLTETGGLSTVTATGIIHIR